MNVAARLTVGSFLAILPLVALVMYLLQQIDSMVDLSRLARADFDVTVSALGLVQRVDALAESASKLHVTQDDRYRQRFVAASDAFARELERLRNLPLSVEGQQVAARLREQHQGLTQAVGPRGEGLPGPGRVQALQALRDRLALLRQEGRAAVESARASIVDRAEGAEATEEALLRLTTAVSALAVIVYLIGFVITLRSITRPLSRLRSATREVSQGRLDTRVSALGNDELAELTRAFNRMVEDLWRLSQKRTRLLAHVSHDLKTPIVAIQETCRLLLEEITGPLNPKQKRSLSLSLSSAERLSRMIDDLLDLARLESGVQYSPQECDLAALVHRAASELETVALEREVQIQVLEAEGSVLASCDPLRVLQAMTNLIDNALEHSPPGGRIKLSAQRVHSEQMDVELLPVVQRDRPFALIQVKDEGAGLAMSEAAQIFEDFYQGKGGSGARKVGPGVGLGLAICREIAQAHEGAVWAKNNSDGPGATFCLLIACTPRSGA